MTEMLAENRSRIASMPIRAFVVDDEPIARAGLCRLLEDETGVDVVGESAGGPDAVAKIGTLRPDLVFMDIEMPEADGFAVLHATSPSDSTCVIFVTAHARYALDAFGVGATDYLLKPFDRARLRIALGKARRFLRGVTSETGVGDHPRVPSTNGEPLVIRDRGRSTFVNVDDVHWVKSDGNYLHVAAGDRVFFLRETLRAIEERLRDPRFARISRSIIVRTDRVAMIRHVGCGRYRLTMRTGHKLESSRRYRGTVRAMLSTNPTRRPSA